jgi:hypothetical protein
MMKEEAKKEIRAKGFGTKFQQQNIFPWTHRQLWRTIKLIVKFTYVPYDRLVFTVFEGNEAALRALAQANILHFVTIDHQKMVHPFNAHTHTHTTITCLILRVYLLVVADSIDENQSQSIMFR